MTTSLKNHVEMQHFNEIFEVRKHIDYCMCIIGIVDI
jgi:hypothetical protein